MKKGYEWLYLLAAALAAIAFCIRLYDWLVRGDRPDVWGLVVPALFAVVLLIMWVGARKRHREGGDG